MFVLIADYGQYFKGVCGMTAHSATGVSREAAEDDGVLAVFLQDE